MKTDNLIEAFTIFMSILGVLGVISYFVLLCYLKNSKRARGLASKASLGRISFTLSLNFCFVLIEISHTDRTVVPK